MLVGSLEDPLVIVLEPDGEPDLDFSRDGLSVIDLEGVTEIEAVAIQGDGRIVVAGQRYLEGLNIERAVILLRFLAP
ncbi:MAG: hypothetical protein JRG94_10620 [Deltaproteobacteria bacterium]|nr:hypothetical protein [Deltaproteobacteria bacterium]